MGEVPLITWTQKLVLYETKARYYIIGSNKAETRFRVLKIDRTEPRELLIHDDKVEYSRGEIRSVLSMIDGGNKSKKQGNNITGLSKNISAFGIAGFVRFLEGYYMILITKRKKAAMIGHHTVYKIEDTSMLYIPNDTVRLNHPDESRYVKMFQNVDLSSNFYFSYSYDLTHTLQYNMTPVINNTRSNKAGFEFKNSRNTSGSFESKNNPSCSRLCLGEPRRRLSSSKLDSLWQDEVREFHSRAFAENGTITEDEVLKDFTSTTPNTPEIVEYPAEKEKKGKAVYGIKNSPNRKFVWNNHLLKGFENSAHSDWILYIIHGFIGQNNICVFGKSLYITLIGRRSNKFAGTRFLKRGTNLEGYVANEIETEQIVQDTAVTCLDRGKVSSFVQHRGSVPLFWSQDISKMVPKPPISLDQRDPYCSAAGMHFNEMLHRYGSPIIVFNLVKTREKKRHESILSDDYVHTIDYLNQFLPAEHKMQYIGFDMARVNKRKDADVMLRLNRIARYCLKQTGFFLRVQPPQAQYLMKDSELECLKGIWGPNGMRQTGAVRTNCVDCLDRTNTAQFAMGRSALAYQLYAMGLMERPQLEFDTDCVKLLEELYEDHGDTLALQYGGSQLVHRIKTYRKISPWTSHSRDIMQTLSRYYSNAFSDLEKQQAFNLFLGVYIPQEGESNLWDLPTDYYLHNKASMGMPMSRQNYCQWWDSDVWETLPLPRDEVNKPKTVHAAMLTTNQRDEHVNSFYEHYRPEELSVFDEMYQMYLSQACWKHLPKHANDFSPFCVRHVVAETAVDKSIESNPSISGKDSTSSTTSFGSEGSSDSSADSDVDGGVQLSDSSSCDSDTDEGHYVSFKDLFPSMKKVYDAEITSPSTRDQKMYERYVDIGRGCSLSHSEICPERPKSLEPRMKSMSTNTLLKKVPTGVDIFPISAFKLDSTFYVEPPPVSRQAKDIYTAYVNRGYLGAQTVSDENRLAYIKYVNKNIL